ncbi:phosphotransferase family protein [Nocardioides sp. LHG3406-4]|uniref:phosphotransferase family protein n=1 Tax=Nocardioides sp. LHG3406-4 TaxID=2804575 RepID=UPI003CF77871
MKETPVGVTDADVLAAVREHWLVDAVGVTHLPLGFGAHHWRADAEAGPALFVTLDGLGPRHSLSSLHSAYAGAAALAAAGLEFVVATLPPYVVAFGDGALSVTPWLSGPAVGAGAVLDPEGDAARLRRLHASVPGPIPVWAPLVAPDFATSLRPRLASPWETGPYGPAARAALIGRLDELERWTAAYHRLAAEARRRPWVPTHGEPHTRNQVRLPDGRVVLVDWESLKLAPRERDLRGIVDAGRADLVDPDGAMLELFDLEWRLDEISQYAVWFASPHTGTDSDEVAFGGLIEELDRP